MPGYGDLFRIQDEVVRTVLKQAFDRIQVLERELATLQTNAVTKSTTAATVDMGTRRVLNVSDATATSDAVTLGQVRSLIDQVKKATY